ncbi:cell death abnormality protein 1-like [Mercenaria mercenaria]|uniref:cell death abnormality protein 1-like n=1 Tax=Mercenaria mercenaria TaxID=6596 RepID=UPI00234F7B6B|nr:cell death abnormality protein 1-like [Mercenaria mercenaria]
MLTTTIDNNQVHGRILAVSRFTFSVFFLDRYRDYFYGAYYGQGSGPIFVDRLDCPYTVAHIPSTNYPLLNDCAYAVDNYYNCGHNKDFSVMCYGPTLNIAAARLVNGTGPYDGRAEINVNGTWGTICDENFNIQAADLFCDLLGLRAAQYFTGAKYGEGNGPVFIDQLFCKDYHYSLSRCKYLFLNECSHRRDISVVCNDCGQSDVFNWDADYLTYNGTTLFADCLYYRTYIGKLKLTCDKHTQTWIKEGKCQEYRFPLDITDIRLVNGSNSTNGRVELKSLDTWGTVCDDDFGTEEANAICRMLGYPRAVTYYTGAHYGQGTGPIFVDDLSCEEDASHINNCTYITYDDCDHGDDVSVFCTESCNPACKACTWYNNCTACPSGKYGSFCQHDCGLGCQNHQCDISSGFCTCLFNFQGNKCNQCVNGKYGNACDINCSVGCANNSCNIKGNCYSCKPGFIGNMCTQCEYGKYGTNCNIPCQFGCSNGTCKNNGNCYSCKDGFMGSKCDQCVDGKYGTNCNIACPSGCSNINCKDNGDCYSCKDGFTGNKCDQCVDGKYGTDCNIACPSGCSNINCKDNGDCYSCKDGFTGSKCDQCVDGKYGIDCNIACPSRCSNISCKDNGDCYSCKGGFTGNKCDQCVDGKYGIDCNIACPSRCSNINCKDNGDCYSCKDEFAGSKCDQCIDGKYGIDCNIACPSGCSNINCKDNGDCYSCKDGFMGIKCDKCVDGLYGIDCEHDCSKYCAHETCNKTSGVCNDGCIINYYGEQCNMRCASTCLPDGEGRRCFHTNGSCVKDCQNGYYGDMCQDRCSENCINIVCLRDNGGCKFGCIDGFEGEGCTQISTSGDISYSADSTNVGAFIGVGVGSVAVTLIAVGIVIILRRCLRRGHLSRNMPEQTYELQDVKQQNVKLDAMPNITSTIERHGEVSGRKC